MCREAFGEKTDLHELRAAMLGDVDAVLVVAVDQHHAILRHDVEQAAEAQLDGVEIGKDIGVVELDVVHHDEFRQVVEELRALVEERGVVFVALENDMLGIVQAGALAEIFGDAADHVAGFNPALCRIQVSIEVVVVLPCVPLTTRLCRPRRKNCFSVSGRER